MDELWECLCLLQIDSDQVSKESVVNVKVRVLGFRGGAGVGNHVCVPSWCVSASLVCAWRGGQWVVGAVYLLCLSDGPLASGPGVRPEKTLAVFSAATLEFPRIPFLASTFGHGRSLSWNGMITRRSCEYYSMHIR